MSNIRDFVARKKSPPKSAVEVPITIEVYRGPKGDKGDIGPQGPQGLKGETGPAGAKFATISSSAEAWVKADGAFSAVPAADITTGAAGICLRAGLVYEFSVEDLGGTNLNFIAAATPLISVAFA